MNSVATAPGLSRRLFGAAGRYVSARLRDLTTRGIYEDWQDRAAICERCPLRVVSCGVSYCGRPFLQQVERDPAVDGCGCPCRDKARSTDEHCPINNMNQPATTDAGACNCKWCRAAASASPVALSSRLS